MKRIFENKYLTLDLDFSKKKILAVLNIEQTAENEKIIEIIGYLAENFEKYLPKMALFDCRNFNFYLVPDLQQQLKKYLTFFSDFKVKFGIITPADEIVRIGVKQMFDFEELKTIDVGFFDVAQNAFEWFEQINVSDEVDNKKILESILKKNDKL